MLELTRAMTAMGVRAMSHIAVFALPSLEFVGKPPRPKNASALNSNVWEALQAALPETGLFL